MPLHVPKDCPVEIAALLLVLLKVLGVDVGAESIQEEHSVAVALFADVSRVVQCVYYFLTNVPFCGEDPLCNSLAEVEGVEVPDPNQLPRGFLGVVLRGITSSRRRAARNGARRSPSP